MKHNDLRAAQKLVKVANSLPSKRDGAAVKKLLRTVTPTSLRILEHAVRRPATLTEGLQMEKKAPADAIVYKKFEDMIANLPPKQRLLVELSEQRGLMHSELCRRTSYSDGGISPTLTRIANLLKKNLQSCDPIPKSVFNAHKMLFGRMRCNTFEDLQRAQSQNAT
jgi:DNA-directed RNA polymerase specialized sigma24 family protein